MKRTNSFSEDIINEIIETAYGDAGFFTKLRVKKLIKINKEAEEIYNEHKIIAGSVKNISPEELPANLQFRLMNITGKVNKPGIEDAFVSMLMRPYTSFASAISVLVLSGVLLFNGGAFNNTGYTQEEIAMAEEAKESLLLISGYLKSSTKTVENTIIKQNVAHPINKGLKVVNNLFNKEK